VCDGDLYRVRVSERRVLIIDDDDKRRALIARVVRVGGWTPITASNGAIACDVLTVAPHPHVILLDLLMPRVNGWQFRARQLANRAWAHIPVVVLSGARHAERAMHVRCVIPKPFNFDQLLTTLHRVIGDDPAGG
jgi:two-component system, chemotaxis family, chemotaxis protein CheY